MDLTDIIIKWAIPTFLTILMTYIIKKLNSESKCRYAQEKATISMIRGQIVSSCEQYIKLGYLPDYARYTINELGTNYADLGGNHGIQELITKTNQLPPIKMKRGKNEK